MEDFPSPITSTNPNGKLFTNLKPTLGTGTVPSPRTAGRRAGGQAGRQTVGWLPSDSQLLHTVPLPRGGGKEELWQP